MSVGRHRLPSRLELTTSVDGATTNLKVDGDLENETIGHFERTVDLIVTRRDLTRLVLDFGPLRYLDSDGVYALMAVHQQAPQNVILTVVNCPPHAREILKVSGLFGVLVEPPAACDPGNESR
jgi:anti-anti-sigma factor